MEVLVVFLSLIALITAQNTRNVVIEQGTVKGTRVTLPDKQNNAYAFYGIPYAASPVGDLRFEPPEKPQPFGDIFDATNYGPICPQNTNVEAQFEAFYRVEFSELTKIPTSESCLTLDVYTPRFDGSRSVMVFIHGGGFTSGGSRLYDTRYLAIDYDIVAVNIQYRLGPLGWFYTGDDAVRGNMGFLDQVAALQWVNDNIAKFGGNPNDVTIYGESAGAMSISLHLASNESTGFFHKAILQSGGLYGSSFFSPPMDLIGSSMATAAALGCANMTNIDMVTCLRSLEDPDVFWKPQSSGFPLPFITVPKQDDYIFPKGLDEILNTDINIMAGCTENEGYIFSAVLVPDSLKNGFDIDEFEEKVAPVLAATYIPQNPAEWPVLARVLMEEYAKNLTGDDLKAATAEAVGDLFISVGTYKTAQLMAEQGSGNVYFYRFIQRPSLSLRPDFIIMDHADDTFFMGVSSTGYFQGVKYDGHFTDEDKQMENIMLGYWTNFAKTGNPNGPGLTTWPEFTNDGSYLILKIEPEPATGFKKERMQFWLKTVPKLLRALETQVVQTKPGLIKGMKMTLPRRQTYAYAFYGIPFAAPPTGDLRFQPPQKPVPWNGVLNVTEYGPVCPQETVIRGGVYEAVEDVNYTDYKKMPTSESCLTLDVYTPGFDGTRSVVVFIHGGAFKSGGSRLYDGRYFAIVKDIVYVAIQYRLGPLGWFATGDGEIKGNMGFLDQIGALQWVKDNIVNFGGNPDDVTIIGESAGARCISLHLASPKSSGLFHRAILQSGGLFGTSFFSPPLDLVSNTKDTAAILGCTNETSADMVSCLQSLDDPNMFWKPQSSGFPLPFKPVAYQNDEVFPSGLQKIINTDIDIIAGCTDFEGYILALFLVPDILKETFSANDFEKKVAPLLVASLEPLKDSKWPQLVQAVTKEYAGNLIGNELKAATAEAVGDLFITLGTYKTAQLMAEYGSKNVFFYKFAQRPSISLRPDFITADHRDDLFFMGSVSSMEYDVKNFTDADKNMENIMMSYWANFAQTGNPNGGGMPNWPSFKDDGSYLILKVEPEPAKGYKADRMKFWFDNFPSLQKPPKPVPPKPSSSTLPQINCMHIYIICMIMNLKIHME